MTLDHNVARRRERTLCLLILLAGTMLKLIYALQVSCYVSPHDLGRLSDWVQRTNGHLGYIQYLYQHRHLLQTSPVGAGQFYHPPLFYLVGAAVMQLFYTMGDPIEPVFELLQIVNTPVRLRHCLRGLADPDPSGSDRKEAGGAHRFSQLRPHPVLAGHRTE